MREFINIILEAEAEKKAKADTVDPKLKQVDQQIQAGEMPVSLMMQLKNFLVSLIGNPAPAEEPESEPEMTEPEAEMEVEPEEVTEDVEAAPAAEMPAEAPLPVVDPKEELHKLLAQLDSEEANIALSFIRRNELAQVLTPILAKKNITKKVDQQQVLNMFVLAPGTMDDKMALVNALATTGVIDTKKMRKPAMGSIDALITMKGNVTLDHLKKEFISFTVKPSTTAVNTGDGEAFFLILGQGIHKLSPGDLNVEGHEIEVKAQGARLKGFGGKGVYGNGATYYKTFNNQLIKIVGHMGEKLLSGQGFDRDQPFHFSASNLRILSEVLAMPTKTPKKGDAVKAMFNGALLHIYPQSSNKMRARVLATIKPNGSFDVAAFRKAWFLLTYEYYLATSIDPKTGKGFDGIMFIHQQDFQYFFVKGIEQFEKNWDKFELNPGLYNWTDAPSVAPKITFGHEIRLRKAKPKKEKSAGSAAPKPRTPKKISPPRGKR